MGVDHSQALDVAQVVYYWLRVPLEIGGLLTVSVGATAWILRHPWFRTRTKLIAELAAKSTRITFLEHENLQLKSGIASRDETYEALRINVERLRADVDDLKLQNKRQTGYIGALLLHIESGAGHDSIPQPPDEMKKAIADALRNTGGLVHLKDGQSL
jgi:hypothetical protein